MRALAVSQLGFAVVACAPAVRSDLTAHVLDSDLQCGREFPTSAATWIDNSVDLDTAYQRISRIAIETLVEVPAVDFERDGVLLVEMGQRGTAGYGVDLASEQVRRTGDTAQVIVRWTEPRPDAVLPSMITSPCVFIVLPRGDYKRIQVIDEQGRVRAETM